MAQPFNIADGSYDAEVGSGGGDRFEKHDSREKERIRLIPLLKSTGPNEEVAQTSIN